MKWVTFRGAEREEVAWLKGWWLWKTNGEKNFACRICKDLNIRVVTTTRCSLVDGYRRFGGTCCLDLLL
jgi:hypothetical protein